MKTYNSVSQKMWFLLLTDPKVGGDEDHVASTDAKVATEHSNIDAPLPESTKSNPAQLGVGKRVSLLGRESAADLLLTLQHQLHCVHTAERKLFEREKLGSWKNKL